LHGRKSDDGFYGWNKIEGDEKPHVKCKTKYRSIGHEKILDKNQNTKALFYNKVAHFLYFFSN
jgi:hypothetical protein